MRHLNSQHCRNLLTDQMEEQRPHQKVDPRSGLLVILKPQIIWVVMETSPEFILPNLDPLKGVSLLEVHTVALLHPEEVWDHHLQAVDLVKTHALIHGTLLVQEVGKGRQRVLYIPDRR